MSQINIVQAKEKDLAWVNECYGSIRFQLSQPQGEYIAILSEDGKRAALGRLIFIDSTTCELSGIYILPEYRSRRYARIMVEHLLDQARDIENVYCLPFEHLEQFYQGYGFERIAPSHDVPKRIAEKLNWCNTTHDNRILLMKLGKNKVTVSNLSAGSSFPT